VSIVTRNHAGVPLRDRSADSHLKGRDNGHVGEFREPVLNIDWDQAVSDLAACGWARAPHALAASEADRLGDDNGRTWTVAGDEGVVRQHVIGSYTPYAEALPVVRAVGDHLIAGLSAAAWRHTQPVLPAFNEATWCRYPAGTGHITAHRDPSAYGGVVAVFTLAGSATVRAWNSDGRMTEWQTGPGQLVVLRGVGWPAADSQCPLHEVDPPVEGERRIMTLRHNLGGAGTGYTV